MVGPMSALLALVAMLSGAMIGEMKTCSDQNALSFIGSGCISWERSRHVNWNDALVQCQGLSNNATKWDLPKLDSLQKNEALAEIMRNNSVAEAFWIGLVRVNGNENQWNDPTKWLWTSDNSTLAETFPKNDAPWTSGEPNGQQFGFRCVRTWFGNGMEWDDSHCEVRSVAVLVCEGTDMDTTAMSSTKSSSPMTTTVASNAAVMTVAFTGTAMTAAMTTAPSGPADRTTIGPTTTFGTVGTNSTVGVSEGNAAKPIGPQSMPKEGSARKSGYVWTAIALALLIVLMVFSLLTIYFAKSYKKRRLRKRGIRHGSDSSSSTSSKRRRGKKRKGRRKH